ncbi:hypothetical protein GCG21_11710 [Pseudactinotalea sp. HY160]|uniref:hypothetical protein n=1 Tax=Pseudactinotalea sp. HY160 TaxID=2654490 RepID=UPI00128B62C1|nr:hypothetical protein [Pseudactinotalea sp. HY160]MPV50658.1 hypothetical protein [Pseudactinotalea sp. HY160]
MALITIPWVLDLFNGSATSFRVLSHESANIQLPLLVLAAAAYLVTHQATIRPYRTGAILSEGAMPLPHWARSLAAGMGLLSFAVLGMLLAMARLTMFSLSEGAAGSLAIFEVLTVPAFVVAAGAIGMLIGRALRSAVAGILLFAVLAGGVIAAFYTASSASWLSLMVPLDPLDPGVLPSSLIDRPAGWHLLWLATLIVVVLVAALLIDRLPAKVGAPVLAIALAGATVAGAMQSQGPSPSVLGERAGVFLNPADLQNCRTIGIDRFCSFPEFESRIPAWKDVVDGVRSAVPTELTAQGSIAVRQSLDAVNGPMDSQGSLPLAVWAREGPLDEALATIPAPMSWAATGDGRLEEHDVLSFAVDVSATMVEGVPEPSDHTIVALCDAPAFLVLWGAARADQSTEAAFGGFLGSSQGGAVWTTTVRSSAGYSFSPSEVDLVAQLLAQPRDVADQAVASLGESLTNLDADIMEVAHLLNMPAPVQRPEQWACE